jgi:hypothetical protein
MQKTEDQNIRKIVVGKGCYSKYCSKCPYCVKSYWEENEGFKHGWIGVECCVNGGKSDGEVICPNGITWFICLGESQSFDPEMIWKPSPKMIENAKLLENEPKRKEWWNEN